MVKKLRKVLEIIFMIITILAIIFAIGIYAHECAHEENDFSCDAIMMGD